jgi:hypothetical protein
MFLTRKYPRSIRLSILSWCTKIKKVFSVYIDGDKLDTFKNQKEAEKAGIEFAKEF